MYPLGFIQGRLSPLVDGKIQAFPFGYWEQEFGLANATGWKMIEWTIDHDEFELNPLITRDGQVRILELMDKFGIRIPSVTSDFVMQAPFYKNSGEQSEFLLKRLVRLLNGAALIGAKCIVIPLVDNGSITSDIEEADFKKGMASLYDVLDKNDQCIVFESDFNPLRLREFIKIFPAELFGINYDSGNSACLGYDVADEFAAYGGHVKNVHIKDRLYGGTTVPLGIGDVDFVELFEQLEDFQYRGNLIFQTARATDNNHVAALDQFRRFITEVVDGSKVD